MTNNEKKVLRKLIENARMHDTEIAKGLNVSQQAVNQIRNKLESSGIILGYIPVIDFTKIGITTLHFMGINVLSEVWKKLSESELNSRICELPFLFMAFRIPASDISYLLIFGFRDITEQERFTKRVESSLAGKMKVAWSYTTALENMLAYDSLNLVAHAMGDDSDNIREQIDNIIK